MLALYEVNIREVSLMENGNNVNKNEEIIEKLCLGVTRVAILTGQDLLPDDVEIYKCPKCKKIFLGSDILWEDTGNNAWEPFCPECERIHLRKI
jgi:hypothetical protein